MIYDNDVSTPVGVELEKHSGDSHAMEMLLTADNEEYASLPPLRSGYDLAEALMCGDALPVYAVNLYMLDYVLNGELKHLKSTPQLERWRWMLEDWDGEFQV